MKHLIIIRHAKSSWEDPSWRDFERPLNPRGLANAPAMASRLKKRNLKPDVLVTSPAIRALETCKIFADTLGYPASDIVKVNDLYHADAETIRKCLQELSSKVGSHDCIAIFGHNPGLTDFTNALLDEYFENIPTCGVVECDLNIEKWKDVDWSCGKLRYFDYPKKD